MKRIIVSLNDFRQGGIPRCLHSLLTFIDKDKYTVDVICLDENGPYLTEISKVIQEKNGRILRYSPFIRKICTFSSNLKEKSLFNRVATILCKIAWKGCKQIFKKDLLVTGIKNKAKLLSNKYDVAISYAEGNCSILISEMECDRKLMWIHNDYRYTAMSSIGTDFHSFDKICCVSEATRLSFIEQYQQFAKKTTTLYNIIDHGLIKELATKPIENPLFKNDLYSIISIGRVSYQKQFTKIPSIASKLKQYGCKFYWYIIGDGPEKQKLEEEITKHNVADTVIILGKQNNPYKYLAKADLFALTSVYESYPTVINEALVLNIPIISNDIPPIYEMLNDKQGFIATIEEFPQRIKWVIDNNWQIQSKTTDYWVKRHNDFVMTMFYNLIENN